MQLETVRLRLRQWSKDDFPAFAALNADPEVMAYFPNCPTRNESDALARRIQGLIADRGWGLWAVEEKRSGSFMGLVGLNKVAPELPFAPAVEIGWRLARAYWGKGYATEAAREALRFAFEVLQLPEVYSFATIGNARSRAVMERLGMHDTGRNFEHPQVPAVSGLREHVLYRLNREQWNGAGV